MPKSGVPDAGAGMCGGWWMGALLAPSPGGSSPLAVGRYFRRGAVGGAAPPSGFKSLRRRPPSAPCPRAAAPVAPSHAHGHARAPCVACAWPRCRRGAAAAVGGPLPLLWAARALAPSLAAPRPAAPLMPCFAPSAPSAGAALGSGRAGGSSGPTRGPLLAPRGRGAPPGGCARPAPGALCGRPSSLVVARLAQSAAYPMGWWNVTLSPCFQLYWSLVAGVHHHRPPQVARLA